MSVLHINRGTPGHWDVNYVCGHACLLGKPATCTETGYLVNWYYTVLDNVDWPKATPWCPECVALLTPLDELAATEL